MEEGHGDVADILRAYVQDHAQPVPGREQSALRAANRLRRRRGSRGEQEVPERLDVGLGAEIRIDVDRRLAERVFQQLDRTDGGIVGIGVPGRDQHSAGKV